MVANPPTTAALVLCGGRSERMGHDKALLRFPGQRLVDRVLANVRQVAGPIVVAVAPEQQLTGLPQSVLTVADHSAHEGPLWGLLEGFRSLQGQADQVLVLAVDLPFFSPAWMEPLVQGMAGQRACLYEYEAFVNPLAGCYRLSLLGKLEHLVQGGERRPIRLAEGEATRVLRLEDLWQPGDGPAPLMDVDTPEAYREALLADGVGNPAGHPVTLRLHEGEPPAALPRRVQPLLPLFAESPREALELAQLVFPELESLTLDSPAGLALLREADATAVPIAGDEALAPEATYRVVAL